MAWIFLAAISCSAFSSSASVLSSACGASGRDDLALGVLVALVDQPAVHHHAGEGVEVHAAEEQADGLLGRDEHAPHAATDKAKLRQGRKQS